MQIPWNAFWFIIGVSLLVTIHEFGHFWVARKLGFKVLRFSVGFGKPLYKKIGAAPDHIEYVIAAIPLGGYVRMLDERDGRVDPADVPRSFGSRPPWQRILVLLAGPAANIIFAVLVLWGMFWVNGITHVKASVDSVVAGSIADHAGLKQGDELRSINGAPILDQFDARLLLLDAVSDDGEASMNVRDRYGADRIVTLVVSDPEIRFELTGKDRLNEGLGFEFWQPRIPPVLGGVGEGGPAEKAGLKAGDEIRSLDGVPVRSFNEFADYINARPQKEVVVGVRRGSEDFTRRITTQSDKVDGRTIGRLMVQAPVVENPYPPEMRTHTDVGAGAAFTYSVGKAWQMTAAQAKFFVRMIKRQFSTDNMAGFLSIAGYAGDAARAGFGAFLMLLVLLSLSLGFLNLLPIPLLDGGQIVFQIVEWLKGGPLSERTYLVGQQAGLVLLALLMGLALFNDLNSIDWPGIFGARS